MSLASRLGDRFRAEFASRIITVVSGAILTVALARLLEPDGYGLLFLAISVLGMFQIFSTLGIPKSCARYISEYKETEPSQIPFIIRSSFLMALIVTGIVSVILLITHEYIAVLIGERDLIPFLLIGVLFSGCLNQTHMVCCFLLFLSSECFRFLVRSGFQSLVLGIYLNIKRQSQVKYHSSFDPHFSWHSRSRE